MSVRKQKPGPRRPRGRPPVAQKRKADRERAKNEREILSENGFKVMTIVVPEAEAATLRRKSRLNRLDGLLAKAVTQEDLLEVERFKHLRMIAELEIKREVQAEFDLREQEERDRLRWQAEMDCVHAAEVALLASRERAALASKPDAPQVTLEDEIRRSQPFGMDKYGNRY